jgi:D-serine deaminase-like pyridoxal phosphate-dependent protein
MKSHFIGTKLQDLPTPCAVLDLAKVEVNCQRMLNAVRRLRLGWRPHIKTHKVCYITSLIDLIELY